MIETIFRRGRSRPLTRGEEQLARKVFAETLPYGRVRIANFYLPGNCVPVTLAASPLRRRTGYTIFWGNHDVFGRGADACDGETRVSFIHELTHVWQGQHHGRTSQGYMLRSAIAQCTHGARDVLAARCWRGWAHHRKKAYDYSNKLGQPWDSFNVEQQAALVADWFCEWQKNDLEDANQPINDARYAYISDIIRAGSANKETVAHKSVRVRLPN